MLELLATLVVGLASGAPQGAKAPAPARVPARIVMVRTSESALLDRRRFAQGLSASALVGVPVCMLVDAALSPIQEDLLRRLPDAALVCVGAPPTGLAQRAVREVAEVHDLYEPVADAVVASMHWSDQLEAAVEACRRRLPLLVADTELAGLVQRLGVKRAFRLASRFEAYMPAGLAIEGIESAAARLAALAEHEQPYLAVANFGAARSGASGTPLGAAALAAAHGGVLLAINEKVEFDYAELRRRTPPEELADHEAVAWLLGGFDLGSGEILVAVPQVGTGPGITGETPRWGDPILDLDGDEKLDPATETVTIGSTRRIGERDWSISLRLIGAIGATKFKDGMRTQRAVRIAPAAETVAKRLCDLYGTSNVTPRFLLIAGDHREVPFDYVKDPVYANSMMHEQELASDNLYGDPDGDGYLDVAVGRFVASGTVEATALAARMATHGYWQERESPTAALIYPAWADDEIKLGMPMIFPSFEAFLRGVAADVESAGFTTRMHLREDGDLSRVMPSLPVSTLVVFTHHSGPDGWQFRIQKEADEWSVDALVPRGHIEKQWPGTAVPLLGGAPLIVGAGCDSAGLDYEVLWPNSIVHTFFERGAMGYVGNTRAGFPDTEEFLLRQLLQSALGMQPGTAGPLSIGESFRQAKNYFDLLIRERGPFRCVEPFENYNLSMRREWTSLVYYGDPALMLNGAKGVPSVDVTAFPNGDPTVELRCDVPLQSTKIWFMEVVGVGPLHEETALLVPGLSYSSIPWATHADTKEAAIVGPGTFLDVVVPESVRGDRVVLRDGPAWAAGGARIVTDVRGRRRLLLSADFVRYAMQTPDAAERTRRLVFAIE